MQFPPQTYNKELKNSMSVTSEQEIYKHIVHDVIQANQALLDAIARNDWATYEKYVDATLTCFEPEAAGHLVEGTDFHRYYFQHSAKKQNAILATPQPRGMVCLSRQHELVSQNTMTRPHVRLMGQHAAIVCYVRLVQSVEDGVVTVQKYEETRVWQNQNMDGWKNVHMHRSLIK